MIGRRSGEATRINSYFFEELKRRNVVKVAVLYLIASWLLLQVTDVLSSLLSVPEWAGSLVVMLLILGFFPTLIFSWVYEMTPEGLKKEKDIDRSQSNTPETGRKINVLIIVMLALAIGAVVIDRLIPEAERVVEAAAIEEADENEGNNPTQIAAVKFAPAPDRSIAVLPFADMSPNKDQEYFSEGLSEELLNLLAKVPELHVAARTSSFSFKDQNLEIPEIAERLKVAHVLEGSVRKSGNQVRITTQLIQAEDGYHLWSETYDRTLDDIFAVQDEIAAAVVSQLKVTLLGETPKSAKADPEAYALYLQGRHLTRRGGNADLKMAIQYYKDALAIDQNLVDAWNGLWVTYSNLAGRGMPFEESLRKSREAIGRALAIDPDNATVYTGVGLLAARDGDFEKAAPHYRKALALEPSNFSVLNNSAILLQFLGRYEDAIPVFEWLARRDPVNATAIGNLGFARLLAGQFEEAKNAFEKALVLSPEDVDWLWGRIRLLYFYAQDYESALHSCESLDDVPALKLYCLAWVYPQLGREDEGKTALLALEQTHDKDWASPIAQYYAWHEQPDAAIDWLEKGYQIDGKAAVSSAWRDWIYDPIRDDPGFQELLERTGVSREQLAAIEFEVPLPN